MKTVDTKHLETKSDAKREAEAMARLRDPLSRAEAQGSTFVYGALTADLRALLDAHAALEAENAKIADANYTLDRSVREVQSSLDIAVDRRESLRLQILDVHDALHHECDGQADLPGEIRALRSAHTEALDALEALEDACASVASWSEECLEFNDPTRAAVRAVLAKAGRR